MKSAPWWSKLSLRSRSKPLDYFGESDSRKMPSHLFRDALSIDHSTAVAADLDKQNYSVCPRHWYVDADFQCVACLKDFTWAASEQKAWFEDYFFWIDSYPKKCKPCRASHRQLVELRKEYDATVAQAQPRGNFNEKRRIVEIVGELESGLGHVPEGIVQTKEVFLRQLAKE